MRVRGGRSHHGERPDRACEETVFCPAPIPEVVRAAHHRSFSHELNPGGPYGNQAELLVSDAVKEQLPIVIAK